MYILLLSGVDWDLDDTIILPGLHRIALFNVYSWCRSRLFSDGMDLEEVFLSKYKKMSRMMMITDRKLRYSRS